MRAYVEGIGLRGPGLDGWAASRPVLAGAKPHQPTATRVPAADPLPPNERRRAVQTVRLALAVGIEAFAAARRDPAATPTIFTSSGGDGGTIHEILMVLASPEPELSPTRFHNSVHNAPAGYWSIATSSHAPSSSLCCHDDSFAAGLLEAAVMATTQSCSVGLISYDVQYPGPLGSVRPIGAPFATALVLSPEASAAAFASIDIVPGPARAPATSLDMPSLEALRRDTPAARSLPLLEALARETKVEIILACLPEMQLALTLRPLAPVRGFGPSLSAAIEERR